MVKKSLAPIHAETLETLVLHFADQGISAVDAGRLANSELHSIGAFFGVSVVPALAPERLLMRRNAPKATEATGESPRGVRSGSRPV